MLVDPKFVNRFGSDAEKYVPKSFRPGIYATNYFLRDMCEVELVEFRESRLWHLPVDERIRAMIADLNDPNHIPDYGMCDSVNQLLLKFPQIVTSSEKLLVTVNVIERQDEPQTGGFRPHKWGTYYGDRDFLGCEYFVDEPNLDQLTVFHVYQVTDRLNPFR